MSEERELRRWKEYFEELSEENGREEDRSRTVSESGSAGD